MVEMIVDSVRVSMGSQQRVVILKDAHEDRYLFIWIGQSEAHSIALGLQGEHSQRPLTHDLLKSIITDMGGRIVQIVISELRQSVYHAHLTIEINGRRINVDSRSSDAIALAVRAKCPIYAAEAVMDEAAVVLDDIEKPSSPSKQAKSSSSGSDDLAIYRDFINSLDILDDFGKSE
jgi:bifunctional DNase/RNase